MMRNRDKTKITFSTIPFLLRLNFTPTPSSSSTTLTNPEWHKGMGNSGACGQSITASPCGSFLLTVFSLQCELPHTGNSPSQHQHRSFPWRVILQEWTVPVWVPHGPQFLPENQPLHGLLSMDQAPARSLLLCGLCTGCKGLCSSGAWSTFYPSFFTDLGV